MSFPKRPKLNDSFDVSEYKYKKPDFTALGEFVFNRTYSRIKDDGNKETWFDVIHRVVSFAYKTLDNEILTASHPPAEMFKYMFNMKCLPAGRSLYIAGTDYINDPNKGMALNSCAFISFEEHTDCMEKPFLFLAGCLMVGTGVGYTTYYSGPLKPIYTSNNNIYLYAIPDSREGWLKSIELLLKSYFYPNTDTVKFDYSLIRPEGAKIKNFGGVSSGSRPLKEAHEKIRNLLNTNDYISSRVITDIMCLITGFIVIGGSRRGATIAFGKRDDEDFITIKDYSKDENKERASYGWAVNNTILYEDTENISNLQEICESIKLNGEPGIGFLNNMRNYGRMVDPKDYKDINAAGCNPCAEQTLESYEVCNLVEVFLNRITSYNEFIKALEYVFLYGKIITTVKTNHEETNKIIAKNRRIGCSLSGIAQFIGKHDKDILKSWLDRGYNHLKNFDRYISHIMGIPESIKITSVKPSGTISLLTNSTPGVHYPISNYYIRRVRFNKTDPLIQQYINMGYDVDDDVIIKENKIISFPISLGDDVKSDVDVEEQLDLALMLQMYWSDNQTSCTLTIDPNIDAKYLADLIYTNRNKIKCISFLPKCKDVYPQLPYEPIDKEIYNIMANKINNCQIIDNRKAEPTLYCDSDKCTI